MGPVQGRATLKEELALAQQELKPLARARSHSSLGSKHLRTNSGGVTGDPRPGASEVEQVPSRACLLLKNHACQAGVWTIRGVTRVEQKAPWALGHLLERSLESEARSKTRLGCQALPGALGFGNTDLHREQLSLELVFPQQCSAAQVLALSKVDK